MFDFDDELPAGFQDADLLQAQYEQESRRYVADLKRGICHHSSRLGRRTPAFYSGEDIDDMIARGPFPERATVVRDQSRIPFGKDLCTDCGELVDDR